MEQRKTISVFYSDVPITIYGTKERLEIKMSIRRLHPDILDEAIPRWNNTLYYLERRKYREARKEYRELKRIMSYAIKEMEEILFPPEDSKEKPKRPLKKQNNK